MEFFLQMLSTACGFVVAFVALDGIRILVRCAKSKIGKHRKVKTNARNERLGSTQDSIRKEYGRL